MRTCIYNQCTILCYLVYSYSNSPRPHINSTRTACCMCIPHALLALSRKEKVHAVCRVYTRSWNVIIIIPGYNNKYQVLVVHYVCSLANLHDSHLAHLLQMLMDLIITLYNVHVSLSPVPSLARMEKGLVTLEHLIGLTGCRRTRQHGHN